jgi:cell division inhibitor SepF
MQVRIIRPSSFDQAKQITDTLLSHRTVLLNLEGLDVNTAQRIVDFASGSCYALHGNFMKISHFIIVITPEDVSISGDISMEGEALAGLSALSGLAGAAAQGGSGDMFSAGANPFVQGIPPYQA